MTKTYSTSWFILEAVVWLWAADSGSWQGGEPCYLFPPVSKGLPAIQAVSQRFKRRDKASASHVCRLSFRCQIRVCIDSICWGNLGGKKNWMLESRHVSVKKAFCVDVLHLCICVGLTLLDYETGVVPLTMASCLLSVASSGEQLSALMGVCACHWPTSQRDRGRERGRESLCAHVHFRICVFVWVYSSYESHSVGATMHLRPARQMCTAWLYFKSTTTIHMVSALHSII